MKRLLSLYDLTGNWSAPYRAAGWEVTQIDKELGQDILDWNYNQYPHNYFQGILIAQPCTKYALSGARWWAAADASGETDYFDLLTRTSLAIVEYFRLGLEFWALENPVGRIAQRVPELAKFRMLLFHPCDYGDPYTKKTVLFGEFRPWLVRTPVKPIKAPKGHHSIDFFKIQKGKKLGFHERAPLRSETPPDLQRPFLMQIIKMDKVTWTPTLTAVLSDHYAKHGATVCAAILRRIHGLNLPTWKVVAKARRMGIRYTGPIKGWKKGHEPHNKGVPMSAEKYAKCAPTMFTPGARPDQTSPDGTISQRYHKGENRNRPFIRVGGRWVQMNRHVWQQANGPIPPGHVIRHRDGDGNNCDLSNLECLTRSEHMQRNYNRPKTAKGMRNYHFNRRRGNLSFVDAVLQGLT